MRILRPFPVALGILAALTAAASASASSTRLRPVATPQAQTTSTFSPTTKGLPTRNLAGVKQLSFEKLPRGAQGKPIVARVNGHEISLGRFQLQLQQACDKQAQGTEQQEQTLRAVLAQPVLDQLVSQALVAQYAEQHAMRPAEKEVDRRLETIERMLPSGKKLGDVAIRTGADQQEIRALVRESLQSEMVKADVTSNTQPASEAQLKEFFKNTPGAILTSSTVEVRASHILVPVLATDSPERVEAAKHRAEMILAQIKGGMDFAQAAQRYSQDRRSAFKGGDLGYFSRGRFLPEFENAVFALEPGQTSGVVRSPAGFHIIRLFDKHAPNSQELYMDFQKRHAYTDWERQSRKSAKIEKFL